MSRRRLSLTLAAALLLLAPSAAFAWLRVRYEDAQVVDRSTLIVVAHIKSGSLQYLDTTAETAPGHSWNYHATLVIIKTLKGKLSADEIPITLFYGIEATVEGKRQHDGDGKEPGTFAKDSIQLYDHADLAPMLCQDATQDSIWLLQQRTGYRGDKTGTGDFGITDPEEIQPLALLPYYQCYLSASPEAAVKDYLPAHPEVTERATRYLDHLEIQRITQIKDPAHASKKFFPTSSAAPVGASRTNATTY
jgi:hypothetical protein